MFVFSRPARWRCLWSNVVLFCFIWVGELWETTQIHPCTFRSYIYIYNIYIIYIVILKIASCVWKEFSRFIETSFWVMITFWGLPRPWNNWKIIITILVGALYKPTWSTATVFWQDPKDIFVAYRIVTRDLSYLTFTAHVQFWLSKVSVSMAFHFSNLLIVEFREQHLTVR